MQKKICNAAICCLLIFAGCTWCAAPQFQLNTEGLDRETIAGDQAKAVAGALEKLFGTPDAPAVPEGADLNIESLKMAAGPIGSDANDHSWGLYRKHCVACHGLSGEGAGANAADLDPYPRDFRDGVFKYTSTESGAKPLREDLLRTIRDGCPGTAMPAFGKLPDIQVQSLVEYVKYLSIRGETEHYLLRHVVNDKTTRPLDVADAVEKGLKSAVNSWAEAAGKAVIPPAPPRTDTLEQLAVSVDRGRELFRTMGGQCFTCHGWTGKGDGERTDLYDDWNKRKLGDTSEETKAMTDRFPLPIQPLRARNFTDGVFHGGNRPIDLYWRIADGINGTPMPAAGPAQGRRGVFSPEEIWDVVNYVRSLGDKGS